MSRRGSIRGWRVLGVLFLIGVGSVSLSAPALWEWIRLETVSTYHEDGSLWQRYTVLRWGDRAGEPEGLWRAYHPNGRKSLEGVRRAGVWQGKVLTWDEDGELIAERFYERGQPATPR